MSQRDDEEYQFTEDEGSHKYETPSGTGASPPIVEGVDDGRKSATKKRVIIIIGIVIGIFCLYKLYGLFTTEPSKPLAAPKPIQTQVQAETPPVVSPPVDKENLKDKVATLEQVVVQNGKSQENLQNEIGGVTSAITEIQSNVAMLTQQINTLAQQQQKNESQTKTILPKEKPKSVSYKKTKKAVSKKQSYSVYYVKALIQGRAWLTNTNGATLTISTGDELPGYGQIQEINPAKGIVMTSSGKVINFMPQDR